MAINFLNTVDLNFNQLNKAAIQNLAADPAAGVLGQVYYNTASSVLKICTTAQTGAASAVWESVSGDIQSVDADTNDNRLGIAVTTPLGPDPKVGLDVIGLDALGAPALDDSLIIYDLDATKNKRLTVGDIVGTSTWKLEGDGADQQTIVNGDVVDFVGGTYISIAASNPSANNFAVTATHDDTSRTNSSDASSPGYGGDIVAIDSITTNTTGHVTEVNTKTYTLPDDTNETYTLPTTAGVVAPNAPTTGIISLTAGGTGSGVKSTVAFTGTTNRIDVSGSTVGTNGAITIDLTEDVSIVDDLTIGGIITQAGSGLTTGTNNGAVTSSANLLLTANNTAIKVGMQVTGTGIPNNITVANVTDAKTFVLSGVITIADGITITFEEVNSFAAPLDLNNNRIHEVKTGVLGTDGVNLAQVELLVAGVGVFKGGYNASTDPGVPVISGASNIALDQGDYFIVTNDGDITFSDQAISVEVGDFIFANAAITASSTPASTEYTFVIADANIAGAGATDGGTEKGVAGFDSAHFDVSATGWVQLNSTRNPYGARVVLDNGANATPVSSPVSRAVSGGQTTFTINIDDASIFGTGALAKNVKVEVINNASPLDTVYPCVERSGSGTLAIKFSGSVAVDLYQVLLTHI